MAFSSPQPKVVFGALPLSPGAEPSPDRLTIDGISWTGIRDVDRMPPFFTTVVGDNDAWLFAGSNGSLCAGRRDPDLAMFPYVTVDQIIDRPRTAGALSIFLIAEANGFRLWEPWSELPAVHPRRRDVFKHPEGNGLCFVETDLQSGLEFRSILSSCARFGIVRECRLSNRSGEFRALRRLDGWHRIIPPGLGTKMWINFSYLSQAYMRHDRAPGLPLGLFTMNAAITDRAEPLEVQRCAAAWVSGHAPEARFLLSTRQTDRFRHGEIPENESEIRGETGAFLFADDLTLAPGARNDWTLSLDTNLDHSAALQLATLAAQPEALAVHAHAMVEEDRQGLKRRLASSDALEHTGDSTGNDHHLANTLFNIMRGGVLPADLSIDRGAFLAWLGIRNRQLAQKHAALVATWPSRLSLSALAARAALTGDPQFQRLAGVYLPLSFSRRHGDPSRPWNRFTIRLTDEQGNPVISWQGNWRDIFQNWEALALSYPTALPAMIASFVDASSADGYNPYRITSEGIDWEVPEPDNPWSHHGYWGDHQIIYLQRLLELAEKHLPGWLETRLPKRLHASADIPYRIGDLATIVHDPRHPVAFDEKAHREALAREKRQGSDGRLLQTVEDEVLLLSFAEKLLIPTLAKLSNLIPGGGIWLNTQRPEWNDANNALVGYGLSMVTVCQLRKHLGLLLRLFAQEGSFPCTEATSDFLQALSAVFTRESSTAHREPKRLRGLIDELGGAGARHRQRVYARDFGVFQELSHARVRALLHAALMVLDASIRDNRREDGLYHSYNLLELGEGTASIQRLHLMLEGQVAVLACGLLTGEESLALLEALRASPLYRADQNSYLLYPNRAVAPFLQRNRIPAGKVDANPLLRALMQAQDRSIVARDTTGGDHFGADIGNVRELQERLEALVSNPAYTQLVSEHRAQVLQLWEECFQHRSFLGRSGTMFAFEGLGSIYWHMVSKLLLSTQEAYFDALRRGSSVEVLRGLAAKYYEIRAGLGPAKSPRVFGAFPTDPYSHTPAHRGAQQPGMTGQVKEELLARRGELGVIVEGGALRFAPSLLRREEFLAKPSAFDFIGLDGSALAIPGPSNSLAFSVCQVPVIYTLGETSGITVHFSNGSSERQVGLNLSTDISREIFNRSGRVQRLEVQLGQHPLLP